MRTHSRFPSCYFFIFLFFFGVSESAVVPSQQPSSSPTFYCTIPRARSPVLSSQVLRYSVHFRRLFGINVFAFGFGFGSDRLLLRLGSSRRRPSSATASACRLLSCAVCCNRQQSQPLQVRFYFCSFVVFFFFLFLLIRSRHVVKVLPHRHPVSSLTFCFLNL